MREEWEQCEQRSECEVKDVEGRMLRERGCERKMEGKF